MKMINGDHDDDDDDDELLEGTRCYIGKELRTTLYLLSL